MATQLQQKNCLLLLVCHLGFFLIIFCRLLCNCQSFLLFPLVLYFILKIIYSLPYLSNLAFPQCVFLFSFFVCCFWTQQDVSYSTPGTSCLLDTYEELLSLLLFLFPIERLQRVKCLLCCFDFRGETGVTLYEHHTVSISKSSW